MPYRDTEGPVTLSILDRLVDAEPKSRAEVPLTRAQSLRTLKTALRRDLEWLLNSHSSVQEPPEGAVELDHSVYVYGLPDITSLSADSFHDRENLLRFIETAIAKFEPRLAAVKVTIVPVSGPSRVLRFLIEGMIRLDPNPEPIAFDTFLDLSSGSYEVKGEASAR